MNDERMPWYMWLVLAGALGMSAPGEYHLAVVAHWDPAVAWVMPLVVSVYGAVAAHTAKSVPKGTLERRSAVVGALAALALALAFQVTAHLMAAGYVEESRWLVAAVSATPPVVVAHLMHMPHVTAKRVSQPTTTMAEDAETVAAATVSGHPVEMAVQPAAMDEGPTPGTGTEAVAGPPVAATVAAPTATGQVAKEAARPDAVPDVRTEQAATASDDDGGPDMLPGLTLVTTGGRSAVAARTGRGQSVPDAATVRAAMAVLTARGVPVTGRTVADHFGVAERTGRRYLKMAA
ncbi:hypothetical protein [Streptomyces syringium]|uniref:hypothetical protein n=1 Tax=Streptomyces syringium TaxID=76729 RepID=UPI003455E959